MTKQIVVSRSGRITLMGCQWVVNWGDVPTWVGSIGAVGALFWAVFLYSRSLNDQRRAQARLIAPVGGAAPVQVRPGEAAKNPSVSKEGMFAIENGLKVIATDKVFYWATVRLVSTSDETFSGLRTWLVMEDGREVYFTLGFNEMAPHEDKLQTCYFWPGEITGQMKVRLQFQDANGRWWERINGTPVRQLRRGPDEIPPRRLQASRRVALVKPVLTAGRRLAKWCR